MDRKPKEGKLVTVTAQCPRCRQTRIVKVRINRRAWCQGYAYLHCISCMEHLRENK